MRDTPVQKKASVAPSTVEQIGRTGVVPTPVKRGPRGPYGPRKKIEPEVSHRVKVADKEVVIYRHGDPKTTISVQELKSLVDKRMVPVVMKAAHKPGYTKIEVVD